MRRVLGTTLLLAGLSLAVSPELLAEDTPEEEAQSSEQDPAQDPPEEAPTEPIPPRYESDWETELDAMIEEARGSALKNREDRAGDIGAESQNAEAPVELSSLNASMKGTVGETQAATLFGTVGGVLVGYSLPTAMCLSGTDLEGIFACLGLGTISGVFGGLVGGKLGEQNVGPVVVGGGALFFGVLGALPAGDFKAIVPGFLLGATAGGYLGYRLWRSRESDGEQYSLLPYWDEKKSGVVLSGRF